jgi:hypothetical protein
MVYAFYSHGIHTLEHDSNVANIAMNVIRTKLDSQNTTSSSTSALSQGEKENGLAITTFII